MAARRSGTRQKPLKVRPERADEGLRHLAELSSQASALFGGVIPLGAGAVRQLLAVHAALLGQGDRRAPGDAAKVLDLLLRLSEGVGVSSGFARSLRGAAVTFARRGFEAARIEEILAAGGVSPRTFYQFFAGKQDVLGALADLFLGVVIDLARGELAREGNAEQRLARLARLLVGGVAIIERLAQVVISEALRPGSALTPVYERFRDEISALLVPVACELSGRAVDAREVRVRLIAAMGALLELKLDSDTSSADLERAEALVAEILAPSRAAS